MNKRPKIQDVAKAAGVSTATVSRTLSSPDKVSEKTRDSVLEAVRATGYRVNRAARNLRTQRSGAILTLVPSLRNPFFSDILSGLERVLGSADYNLLITDTSEVRPDSNTLHSYLEGGQADGLVILDGSIGGADLELLAGGPYADQIIYACEWFEGTTVPSVRSDNAQGIEAAIDHLSELGHTKIAHICGPAGNVLSDARKRGFMVSMAKKNLNYPVEYLVAGDFNLEAGRAAARTILKLEDRPTGVVCASDELAFGLIAELGAHGLSVPDDVSVVGFDDIEMAEVFIPALTTIHQDRIELGRRAAKLLLEVLADTPADDSETTVVLPVTLVARNSTAPLT